MSDVLEIPCGGCGRGLRVAPKNAGKMARCPVCGHITHVPASLAGTSSATTSEASGQRELAGEGEAGRPSPNETPDITFGGLRSTAPPPFSIHGDTAEWYMKTPEEQTFGPASFPDLERWVQEGRITADCQLCQGAAGNWQPADWLFPSLKTQATYSPHLAAAATFTPPGPMPSQYPAPRGSSFSGVTAPTRYVVPHRGPLILVLGIMGLFITCPVFPLMSWVMGSNDLREMDAGRMDPSGRDVTRAGMIIGMVLSILWILGFVFIFVMMLAGAVGN